jgi:hypothetical protein
MANAWIEHVKKYAAKNGVSYKEAMKLARDSYRAPVKPAAKKPVKPAAKKPVKPAAKKPVKPAAKKLVKPAAKKIKIPKMRKTISEFKIKVVCPECQTAFFTDFPYESSPPQAKCPSCGEFVIATKSHLKKIAQKRAEPQQIRRRTTHNYHFVKKTLFG